MTDDELDDAERIAYPPYQRWLRRRRREHSWAAYTEWQNRRGPSWRARIDGVLRRLFGRGWWVA